MVIAPALPSPKPKPRIIVYIDGLNLYYGVLQQVPAEKWLEVKTRTLCKKRKGCGTQTVSALNLCATRRHAKSIPSAICRPPAVS